VRGFLGQAIAVFGFYAAVLLGIVIAGFIGQAVGTWAAVLWGVVAFAGIVLYQQRRRGA
jgi:predicted MFS family arabinose efflux permease